MTTAASLRLWGCCSVLLPRSQVAGSGFRQRGGNCCQIIVCEDGNISKSNISAEIFQNDAGISHEKLKKQWNCHETCQHYCKFEVYFVKLRLTKDKVDCVFELVDGVMVKFGCDFPQFSSRSHVFFS